MLWMVHNRGMLPLWVLLCYLIGKNLVCRMFSFLNQLNNYLMMICYFKLMGFLNTITLYPYPIWCLSNPSDPHSCMGLSAILQRRFRDVRHWKTIYSICHVKIIIKALCVETNHDHKVITGNAYICERHRFIN